MTSRFVRLTAMALAGVVCAAAGPALSKASLKCSYDKSYVNDKFVGGGAPAIVGSVTHLDKRYRDLKRGAGVAGLDSLLAANRDGSQGGKAWSERDRQPYHVLVAYRRVPRDVSGSTAKGSRASLIKCRRAEHYIGDGIVLADVLGTSIFRGIFEGAFNLPSAHQPLEVYADFTYTLEYRRAGSGGYVASGNDHYAAGEGKMRKTRVPHPSAPKKLVLQSLTVRDGLYPGAYDLRLTASVEIKCDGPSGFCGIATATGYDVVGWLLAALSAPAAPALTLFGVATGIPTDPESLILWGGQQVTGAIVEQSATKVVVEYAGVTVPATVPDLRGMDKCDAPDQLTRRGLGYRIVTQIDPDRSKSQKVAGSDPGPFEQVAADSQVTMTVKTPDTGRRYPCKRSVEARMRNLRKGSSP